MERSVSDIVVCLWSTHDIAQASWLLRAIAPTVVLIALCGGCATLRVDGRAPREEAVAQASQLQALLERAEERARRSRRLLEETCEKFRALLSANKELKGELTQALVDDADRESQRKLYVSYLTRRQKLITSAVEDIDLVARKLRGNCDELSKLLPGLQKAAETELVLEKQAQTQLTEAVVKIEGLQRKAAAWVAVRPATITLEYVDWCLKSDELLDAFHTKLVTIEGALGKEQFGASVRTATARFSKDVAKWTRCLRGAIRRLHRTRSALLYQRRITTDLLLSLQYTSPPPYGFEDIGTALGRATRELKPSVPLREIIVIPNDVPISSPPPFTLEQIVEFDPRDYIRKLRERYGLLQDSEATSDRPGTTESTEHTSSASARPSLPASWHRSSVHPREF